MRGTTLLILGTKIAYCSYIGLTRPVLLGRCLLFFRSTPR